VAPASHQPKQRSVQCLPIPKASKNGNWHKASNSTGYLWHELYFWHCAGPWGNLREFVQPMDHSPEHVETKRR
jgi:hypothetical protein